MSNNKSSKELAGVRVAHDFSDFIEDRETVLTLKDTYVLSGQDVNRDIDVLENIHMAEDFRHQALQENRKKVYNLCINCSKCNRKMVFLRRNMARERRSCFLIMMRLLLKKYNLDFRRCLKEIIGGNNS